MPTISHIAQKLGGATALGVACGFTQNQGARGNDMIRRGSIPSKRWQAIVEYCQARDISEITYEMLARAHSSECSGHSKTQVGAVEARA